MASRTAKRLHQLVTL